jgi:hypothetical protein
MGRLGSDDLEDLPFVLTRSDCYSLLFSVAINDKKGLDFKNKNHYNDIKLLRNKIVAQQFDCIYGKELIMPELITGPPPRGEDYYGQEALIENIWSKLEHNNVLLVAPRRFGKTGAMIRLLDEPRRDFRPLYLDVEPIEHAADFMIELIANLVHDDQFARVLDSLWKGTKILGKFIRNLPAHIDLGGVKVELREQTDVPEKWLSYGERIMSLLSKDGPPLLLLIDEFAIMINTIARSNETEMKQLLRWFRAARIAPKTQTRFVIGGSINLITTLDSFGLVDTVNDLSIIRLKPFAPQTARNYVEAIFKTRKAKVQPEIIDLILELVGEPIPYLLAVLLSSIFDRHRGTKSDITIDMVKDAFEDDLLGGTASAFFRQYRSRIDQYYPANEALAAKALLGTLS